MFSLNMPVFSDEFRRHPEMTVCGVFSALTPPYGCASVHVCVQQVPVTQN